MHANRRTDVPEDPSHTATRQRLMDRRQAVLSRVTRTERELHWLGANVESDAAEESAEDTAADLLLPRLLSGDPASEKTVAKLGHGGILTRSQRFRFPPYARELDAPDG